MANVCTPARSRSAYVTKYQSGKLSQKIKKVSICLMRAVNPRTLVSLFPFVWCNVMSDYMKGVYKLYTYNCSVLPALS